MFLKKDSAARLLILILYDVVSDSVHLDIWIVVCKKISVFHSGLMHANTQSYALNFLLCFLKNGEKIERLFSVEFKSYLTSCYSWKKTYKKLNAQALLQLEIEDSVFKNEEAYLWIGENIFCWEI